MPVSGNGFFYSLRNAFSAKRKDLILDWFEPERCIGFPNGIETERKSDNLRL
ncbi:hypothetical protein P872_05475 [Rhodonellum psychrophilum GCM71 = DSM 17998]|uniref:Uncharacterized protein n=1 Tax=Rhodonellum psychrophilum GCM71 = DSM 17998 TaxID=1123057 RepID=U5C3Z3_9BACT|nr:hypothetical protein P872_05475 [Rhodonellum psychrophilum GCM71 = DSM 17998]